MPVSVVCEETQGAARSRPCGSTRSPLTRQRKASGPGQPELLSGARLQRQDFLLFSCHISTSLPSEATCEPQWGSQSRPDTLRPALHQPPRAAAEAAQRRLGLSLPPGRSPAPQRCSFRRAAPTPAAPAIRFTPPEDLHHYDKEPKQRHMRTPSGHTTKLRPGRGLATPASLCAGHQHGADMGQSTPLSTSTDSPPERPDFRKGESTFNTGVFMDKRPVQLGTSG